MSGRGAGHREDVVGGKILHPRGKALVEPEVVPPLHGDQVAEPLVRELVGDHSAHALLLLRRSFACITRGSG